MLQQLLFQLEKAAFLSFIMSVQDPTHPGGGKNIGPDLPLLFKLHEICSVDFRKIFKIVAARCQILSLKWTKIDFGWGLQRSPRPPNWILGDLLLRGGREGKGGN